VLLLDEPTNDLDTDTLASLEDLLDTWPGTLVVASHDRYLIERICDSVFALLGDGRITHLPGGIDQYLTLTSSVAAPIISADHEPQVMIGAEPRPPAHDRDDHGKPGQVSAAQAR